MIEFLCPRCRKKFSVGDEMAGRRGKCIACGGEMIIPDVRKPGSPAPSNQPTADKPRTDDAPMPTARVISTPSAPAAPRKKLPMRLRRLTADAEQVHKAFHRFPYINVVAAQGDPPERYEIEYVVRGLVRGPNGQPAYRDRHVVEIQLTSEYPRMSPRCKMLTPIFHPNIEPAGVCVGDHWTAGERLVDLIIRIGEMIGFQAYNIKSPLDGEAAMWADKNSQTLPTDNRDLRPPDLE